MKENTKRKIIITSYWLSIGILVWFSKNPGMPFIEKLISFSIFSAITILISIVFSRTLFRKTITNQKTAPFIIKFIFMTAFMALGFSLMYKFMYLLELKGFIDSTYYIEENLPMLKGIGLASPGLIAANLVFCVILLYYEHSLLQQSNLQAQLKLLHAQINPHFMFNVLNYLHVLMQKDTELASTLLLKYADVLRYQLYSGKNATVKLDQEIQFLKDFIDVEKFRWEDKLEVHCSWSMDNPKKDIPPLLFIPFIENAFKHVSRSTTQKGAIRIFFEQKGNLITLEVENSKTDRPEKKKSTGIGLENIKARLEILLGQRYSLTIKDSNTNYHVKLKMYL